MRQKINMVGDNVKVHVPSDEGVQSVVHPNIRDSVFELLNAFIFKTVQETSIPENVVSAPTDTVSHAIRLECSSPPFIHSFIHSFL
jgi:hypothetical protein